MKENEKALVAAFVGKQVQRIQRYRQQYDVSGLEQGSGELAFDLEKQGTDPATAHQHVEDALRYLVFYLADCALHSKANKVGILLNVHRMQCEKNLGRTGWYIGKWLFGRLMGFTHSPLRLAGFAFGVWLAFSLIYAGITLRWDAPAITDNAGQPPAWYHYPYFSAVTLATLGYGDFSPNAAHPWAWLVCILACLEAIGGYVILGMFIALFLKRVGPHQYARLSYWLDDYEAAVLGPETTHGGSSGLSNSHWPGYKG